MYFSIVIDWSDSLLFAPAPFGKQEAVWNNHSEAVKVAMHMCDTRVSRSEEPGPAACHSPYIAKLKDRYQIAGSVNLFNRHELCRVFDGCLQPSEKQNDLLILVIAYDKWGSSCPAYLLGDFVFIIWDRHKQVLFGATDHLGTYPCFYYYNQSYGLIVANTISGIRRLSPNLKKIDFHYLLTYLSDSSPQPWQTPFSDISMLPAASSIQLTGREKHISCYWQFDRQGEKRFRSGGDYVDELKGILVDSVADRLPKTGETGILLSGGLDSSTIACLAALTYRRQGRTPKHLHAFCRTFAEPFLDQSRDEKDFATACAAWYELPISFCQTEILSPLDHLQQFYNDNHCLPVGPFRANTIPLLETVVSRGITNLLTGFGGDEMVSMHGEHVIPWLIQQGRFHQALSLFREYQRRYHKRLLRCFRSTVISPLLPVALLSWYRKLRHPRLTRVTGLSFINKRGIKQRLTTLQLQEEPDTCISFATVDRIREQIFQSRFQYLLADFQYSATKFGLHITHPLLDKRLVEFFARLPPEELLAQGWERSILRRAMQGILPENVRTRRGKSLFNIPYTNYIRNGRDVIETTLARRSSQAWDLVDRQQLQSHLNAFLHSPQKITAPEWHCRAIGRAVNVAAFIQWIEHH